MDEEGANNVPTKTLQELKFALLQSYLECSERRLLHSANWAAELAASLPVSLDSAPQVTHSPMFVREFSTYSYGKSLFDLKEFRRAWHALNECQCTEGVFLRLYSLYLAGEKNREDQQVESIGDQSQVCVNPFLQEIKAELSTLEDNDCLDGFGYYLYGVVEKEARQVGMAREKFVKACHLNPLIWAAWEELAHTCTDRDMLNGLQLPEHWMRDFYLAAGSLKLLLVNEALTFYNHLCEIGFVSSNYVGTQLALVHYHLKDFEHSAVVFESVRSHDPFTLLHMDVYSHVLFVMEKLPELYKLAIEVDENDKYRSETCSVIGNFYSLNGDHEKACAYFKRGIKMDKTNHTSWILLGHEYLELKNYTLAIEAYTSALDSNKNDFRIYYGLGHAYELLRMPYFAITYYKMAYKLQPSDSRVLHAMGYCYEMLEQYDSAKQCYKKSIAFPDPEGTSVLKLAKLHIKLSEEESAAKLYTKFISLCERGKILVHFSDDEGGCHIFLARYHMRKGQYPEAEAHAHKAMQIVETREEGKSVLQEIYKNKDPTIQQQKLTELADLILNREVTAPEMSLNQQ